MSFKARIESKYQIAAKQIGFMAYVEKLLNNYEFDELFDEMARGHGYDEKKLVSFVKDKAKADHITLLGDDDEKELFEMYKATEKGLS